MKDIRTYCHFAAALLCASAALIAPAANAQATNPAPVVSAGILPIPDYTGDMWTRGHLAGDFDGGRAALANRGIQLGVDWTQIGQSIVDGGRKTDNAYGGNVDTLIHLDLMRMGVMQGALITIRAESRYGESVNGSAGPILPVNSDAFFPLTDGLDDGICLTITNLNYTQFLSEQLAVFGGKLDTLDSDLNEFASGRGTSQFMNANFLFNPTLALRLPYSTLGAGVLWLPTKDISIKATLVNTIDSSTTTGFDDFGDGLSFSAEASYQYRLGNLPGGMNVGGLYSFDQDFTQVGGRLIFQPGQGLVAPNEDDTWAVYWSGWQYVFVENPNDKPISVSDGVADHQGIGVFARAGFADRDTNPIEWSISAGIGGRGIIPGRDHDTFGVGYYYSSVQLDRLLNATGGQDHNQGAEAYYDIAITPAMNLTLDAQVVDDALPGTDTSIIVGARLGIEF